MNKLLPLLLCCLLMSFTLVQKAGFSPVKDEAGFRLKFNEASQKLTAIKADFTQEKELSMLSEKMVSKGSFYFQKQSKVRLEYKSPFTYLMVINGSKVLIKDAAKESKFDTHNNKIFKQVNDLIISSVQGTILNSPDFKAKVLESSGQYLLELTPTGKGLKDFFSGLHVFIDKKDYTVVRIVMIEVSGDSTTINLTNKELNGKLDESLFRVS